MITYLFIIIIIISIIILYSFKNIAFFKTKKRTFQFKLVLLTIVSLVTISFYFNFSIYWMGTSFVNKFKTKTNIENKEANEIAIIREGMIKLEKELIVSPNSLKKILELAEIKFLLGYLDDALILYSKARGLSPKSINIMMSEVQVRVLLENESFSKETLNLLNNILAIEENNILALYLLGNYEYANKNFIGAKKKFQVLKNLLKKNTQEYNEIQRKILEMEKGNDK